MSLSQQLISQQLLLLLQESSDNNLRYLVTTSLDHDRIDKV